MRDRVARLGHVSFPPPRGICPHYSKQRSAEPHRDPVIRCSIRMCCCKKGYHAGPLKLFRRGGPQGESVYIPSSHGKKTQPADIRPTVRPARPLTELPQTPGSRDTAPRPEQGAAGPVSPPRGHQGTAQRPLRRKVDKWSPVPGAGEDEGQGTEMFVQPAEGAWPERAPSSLSEGPSRRVRLIA